MRLSEFLERSCMVSDDGNLFYVTYSCYKLKKGSQSCYARFLIGILRIRAMSL